MAAKHAGNERNKLGSTRGYFLKSFFVAFCIALVAELLLFNMGFWASRGLSPSEVQIAEGPGLEKQDDGSYVVLSSEGAYLELKEIDQRVNNVHIDLLSCDDSALNINISMTDAAHSTYTTLPATAIAPSTPLSSYVELHTTGDTESLLISILEAQGYSFSIKSVQVNVPVPFDLSLPRAIAVFVVLSLLLCLRPSSPLYSKKAEWSNLSCRVGVVALVIIEVAMLFVFSYRGLGTNDAWEAHDQYDDLANAFIAGSVSLDKEVPSFLEGLDNPYDPGERGEYLAAIGDPDMANSFTDFAYYEGELYSYFGPVPAVELFVPFKLLTAHDMPTWIAVFFYGAVFMAFVKMILYLLPRKMMGFQSSIGLFLLADFLLCGSSGLLYLGWLPVVYSVPIVASLAHLAAGLSLWLLAKKEDGTLSKPLLVLGALCIALTLGCRQSFILCCLLAIPLFWDEITKRRLFFSKKGIANTFCVIAPFVLVGVCIMAYNYVRFDSPFDFGANYNLTSNDMTQRGFDAGRFPLGIFAYLFQPATFTSAFPFMSVVNVAGDYQGYTSAEPMFGGFFFFSAIAFVAFAFFSRKFKVEGPVRAFALSCMGLGFILLLFDIQASGITARYMSDFSFLFLLAAVLALFAIEKQLRHSDARWVFSLLCLLGVALSLTLNIWALFIDGRYSPMYNMIPSLYYGTKQTLSFLW